MLLFSWFCEWVDRKYSSDYIMANKVGISHLYSIHHVSDCSWNTVSVLSLVKVLLYMHAS